MSWLCEVPPKLRQRSRGGFVYKRRDCLNYQYKTGQKGLSTHGPSVPQKANLSVDNVPGQSRGVQTEIASVVTSRAELKFT
jgi:hypothetical protein